MLISNRTLLMVSPVAGAPGGSDDPRVCHFEVALPRLSLASGLPLAADRVRVIGKDAAKALLESEDREGSLLAKQSPFAVIEVHSVDACDAASVEVVLDVPVAASA